MTVNLLDRVLSEYRDMPGLRLTQPQAARLWGLSPDECDSMLETLVVAGHLYEDHRGQFALRHAAEPALAAPWQSWREPRHGERAAAA